MTMSYDKLLMKLNELEWNLLGAVKDSFKVMIVLEKGDRTTCERKHYTFSIKRVAGDGTVKGYSFEAMWSHVESDIQRWSKWNKHVSA